MPTCVRMQKIKNKYTLLLLQSIPSKLKGITDYHAPIKKQFVKHTLLDVLEFSRHKHSKPNILFSQHTTKTAEVLHYLQKDIHSFSGQFVYNKMYYISMQCYCKKEGRNICLPSKVLSSIMLCTIRISQKASV